jgi:hypothetical protein
MPDIEQQKLLVPSQQLTIMSPDVTAEVPITSEQDFAIAWTPSDKNGPDENVVVSLNAVPDSMPNARGVELRCFYDRSMGNGKIPKLLLARFAGIIGNGNTPGAPIKGKLRFATHRQLTIFAKGGWTVYVVATAEQREQPFTLP